MAINRRDFVKVESLAAAGFSFGLKIKKENYFADIVVFDPNTIIKKATFVEPKQFAAGLN